MRGANGQAEVVGDHDSAHGNGLGRCSLCVGEVVLANFFAHSFHDAFVADHGAKSQGEGKGTLRPDGDTHVFEEAGGPVRLALTHTKGLGAHTGKKITLGVRPEHCSCLLQFGNLQANQFESTVENVEPMGAETFLYLNTGAHQLVSRIPNAVDRAEAGHRLRFQIDCSQVHFFETESGTRLV